MISGFINVDKPPGITSHDVVHKLRVWTKIKRIGHAGTLDPNATGVLPIAIGSACRLLPYLSNNKVYLAEVCLGLKTATDDLAGTIIEQKEVPVDISQETIKVALLKLSGLIEQKPPVYSAIRHKGRRLYDLARRGEKKISAELDNSHFQTAKIAALADTLLSDLPTRSVTIDKIDILSWQSPIIQLRIVCSAGTYIRSLARDLGQLLGCGACLQSLRREKSGPFTLEKALSMDALRDFIQNGNLRQTIVDAETILNLKVIKVDQTVATLIAQGQILPLQTISTQTIDWHTCDDLCLLICTENFDHVEYNTPLAICEIINDEFLKPKVVLFSPDKVEARL